MAYPNLTMSYGTHREGFQLSMAGGAYPHRSPGGKYTAEDVCMPIKVGSTDLLQSEQTIESTTPDPTCDTKPDSLEEIDTVLAEIAAKQVSGTHGHFVSHANGQICSTVFMFTCCI